MRKENKVVHKLNYVDAEFVCPEAVNSTVRVAFSTDVYENGNINFDGDVNFGDCSRTITWSEYSLEGMTRMQERLDKTISVLSHAGRELMAQRVFAENFLKELDKKKKSVTSKQNKKRKARR